MMLWRVTPTSSCSDQLGQIHTLATLLELRRIQVVFEIALMRCQKAKHREVLEGGAGSACLAWWAFGS